jgi:hypothetical protein
MNFPYFIDITKSIGVKERVTLQITLVFNIHSVKNWPVFLSVILGPSPAQIFHCTFRKGQFTLSTGPSGFWKVQF